MLTPALALTAPALTLSAPALTFVFLCVVVGLGAAFVWLFWEIEQMSKPQRDGDRFN